MSIKRAAASSVLGLLFVSLIVIYLATRQDPLVTGLCMLIMAISLLVALTGEWREIGVVTGFAVLVSVVAAWLFGQARFGSVGGVVLAAAWGLLLLLAFAWISRNTLYIPRDRAVLIANTYSGTVRMALQPMSRPVLPLVERIIARIPLDQIRQCVTVEKINTNSGQDVPRIEVGVRFAVINAQQFYLALPNRSQVMQETAKQLNMDVERARTDESLWSRLLAQQMSATVEAVLRTAVFETISNSVEAYRKRDELAKEVYVRLKEATASWGVDVARVTIDTVGVEPDRFKSVNPEQDIEKETRLKRLDADNTAHRITVLSRARAESEAARVTKLIEALRQSGVELSPEDLEEIVISAIRASAEFDSDPVRLLPEPIIPARPAAEKKDNGTKK